MRIKIYHYLGSEPREEATGFVDLNYPPKVTKCETVHGNDVWIADEVRKYVELILKNDLLPGHLGLEGTVKHYKPPVERPIVQINGADYGWTIEETPFENIQEEIEGRPKSATNSWMGK